MGWIMNIMFSFRIMVEIKFRPDEKKRTNISFGGTEHRNELAPVDVV